VSDDALNLIGDLVGFVGLFALIIGAFPGGALATRYGHAFSVFLRGRSFYWHRAAGIFGLVLFFAHPIPFLFRQNSFGLEFPTYLAPVNGTDVNLGIFAFYALVLVSLDIASGLRCDSTCAAIGARNIVAAGDVLPAYGQHSELLVGSVPDGRFMLASIADDRLVGVVAVNMKHELLAYYDRLGQPLTVGGEGSVSRAA
jgi:hypothetical protein